MLICKLEEKWEYRAPAENLAGMRQRVSQLKQDEWGPDPVPGSFVSYHN